MNVFRWDSKFAAALFKNWDRLSTNLQVNAMHLPSKYTQQIHEELNLTCLKHVQASQFGNSAQAWKFWAWEIVLLFFSY